MTLFIICIFYILLLYFSQCSSVLVSKRIPEQRATEKGGVAPRGGGKVSGDGSRQRRQHFIKSEKYK